MLTAMPHNPFAACLFAFVLTVTASHSSMASKRTRENYAHFMCRTQEKIRATPKACKTVCTCAELHILACRKLGLTRETQLILY